MRKTKYTLPTLLLLFFVFNLVAQEKGSEHSPVLDSAAIYKEQGTQLYKAGNYAEALAAYQKGVALKLTEVDSSALILADDFLRIGNTFFRQRKKDPALLHFLQSMGVYLQDSAKHALDIAHVQGRIGAVHFATQEYEKANEYYLKSVNTIGAIKGEDHPSLAYTYYNIGINYGVKNDYDKALAYMKKSARILIEQHTEIHPDIAFIYRALGKMYREMGDFKTAKDYFLKAVDIRIATKTTNHPDMGQNYETVGEIYEWENKYEEALKMYQKALAVYQAKLRPDHPRIGNAYFMIGKSFKDQNKLEEAIAYLKKAQDIGLSQNGKNSIEVAWNYMFLGEIYYQQKAFDEAFEQMQKSLASTVKHFEWQTKYDLPSVDNVILQRTLLQMLDKKVGLLYDFYKNHSSDLKDLQAAFDTGKKAVDLMESNRKEYQFDEAKQQLLKHSSRSYQQTLNIGLELLSHKNTPDFLEQLFILIEQNRGVILQEAMISAQSKLSSHIPKDLLKKENQLMELLAADNDFLKQKDLENQVLRDSLEEIIFKNNRKLDSLYAVLESGYPNYQHLKYELSLASSQEIAAQTLNAETAILEYVLRDSNLFILAITKEVNQFHLGTIDSSFYHRLENIRTFLNNDFNQYTATQQTENRQQYIEDAHFLYQQLLAPILSKMDNKKELIIIPDGLLNYLPFEALLSERPTPPYDTYDILAYAIKNYIFRYEYSANLLLQNEQPQKVTPQLFAGFAPAYQGNNLIAARSDSSSIEAAFPGLRAGIAPLRYNQPEVQEIAGILNGKAIQGINATEQSFKENAADYQILHLAMHGFVNDAFPNRSHLVFTESLNSKEDRFLYVYELYNMQLKADLAVLSACETGAGKIQQGEGVMSLSRAFKYSGVPNVIMSLWKADDAQTKDLMVQFYQNLQSGKGKGAALQAAKLAQIAKAKDNKDIAHPFYWSNFVLMGNNTPITISNSINYGYLLCFGLLILGLFLFFRKK